MSEYISKDKVREIIENRDSGFLACLKALDEILELPDEVVRCKDCKYAIQDGDEYLCIDDAPNKPDDFCSYGERKDEEAENG